MRTFRYDGTFDTSATQEGRNYILKIAEEEFGIKSEPSASEEAASAPEVETMYKHQILNWRSTALTDDVRAKLMRSGPIGQMLAHYGAAFSSKPGPPDYTDAAALSALLKDATLVVHTYTPDRQSAGFQYFQHGKPAGRGEASQGVSFVSDIAWDVFGLEPEPSAPEEEEPPASASEDATRRSNCRNHPAFKLPSARTGQATCRNRHRCLISTRWADICRAGRTHDPGPIRDFTEHFTNADIGVSGARIYSAGARIRSHVSYDEAAIRQVAREIFGTDKVPSAPEAASACSSRPITRTNLGARNAQRCAQLFSCDKDPEEQAPTPGKTHTMTRAICPTRSGRTLRTFRADITAGIGPAGVTDSTHHGAAQVVVSLL